MNCPVDGTALAIADRQGIEVDYCPQCRGVWLDRGELDKLIERSAQWEVRDRGGRERDDDRYDDRRERHDERRGYKKSKRKSLLGELFEFGD